ncbi:MAG TPA: transcription antitermination factor NusB [Bacteroidia bacterium]|nr:transcription antitermination factor NusB [Bacteroidia bacterium]HNT80855.1 transcription antitermination factor NusB [Bacteroidia bacterium]
MLNRRYLRIKALLALYAYFQNEERNSDKAINGMYAGLEKLYDLYLFLLLALPEIAYQQRNYFEDLPKRLQESEGQKKHPLMLDETNFIKSFNENKEFELVCQQRKINWQMDHEFGKQLFSTLRNHEFYKSFMRAGKFDDENVAEFFLGFYKQFIAGEETVYNYLEDKNIQYAECLFFAHIIVQKTLRESFKGNDYGIQTSALYKDEEDEKSFLKRLFNHTIENDTYFSELIAQRTRNWDIDRIALMDTIILKMILAEVMHFPFVPIKVSINEYIDISKEYSTPKSKSFINGVVDKIISDLKEKHAFEKKGRGLIE